MEGTKSKKEEMRGHLCQINTWYESLRWHYPNQVKGRNGITLPLSRFSPAPPVYKKLCSIVIIVWHIGKCKKIFLLVRRRGDFICCLKSLEKYKESSYPTD